MRALPKDEKDERQRKHKLDQALLGHDPEKWVKSNGYIRDEVQDSVAYKELCLPPPVLSKHKFSCCQPMYMQVHRFLGSRKWAHAHPESPAGGIAWIDIFILSNLILTVTVTITACLMILFEETDYDDKWFGLDLTDAFGAAICHTLIPFALILNISMVLVGVFDGANQRPVMVGNNLLALAMCLNVASIFALVLFTWYFARSSTHNTNTIPK